MYRPIRLKSKIDDEKWAVNFYFKHLIIFNNY
uniref:Uncharacterized protein n=1 Tax=Arundo donax TaxID=35708 RepID=A0A0A9SSR7_ARUDO